MKSSTIEAVPFDNSVNRPFQRDLKARVKAYLARQPNGRFATPAMAVKVTVYIAGFWLLWWQICLVPHSAPVAIGLILFASTWVMGLAYNVSHDAVHQALSRRSVVNELLFHGTFNLLGPNAYLWRLRHRVMHHMCVNIPGLDFNIEASDILRFSPTQTWRPMHRWQHLYAPFAYLLFTFHWVFIKDFKMLSLRRIGNVTEIGHGPAQIAGILAFKALHVGLVLVVPVVLGGFSVWHVVGGYLLWQGACSFQFVLTFTGSHLNRGLVFVERREDGTVPHSFLEHQLRTSMDFHPQSPVISFLLGGFNNHVAHHMFPQICSCHYPALTAIIRDTAREHDLPYLETTLDRLFVDHFRYLYDLGRSPEAPVAAYMHTP